MVYGDPEIRCSLFEALDPVEQSLSDSGLAANLDDLRTRLIRIGQLEQAIADIDEDSAFHSQSASLTDAAARLFVECFNGNVRQPVKVRELTRALRRHDAIPDQPLRIKVPEGFEFYALFPEQYIAASGKFIASCKAARDGGSLRVLVIGIRSIGTTLSAVVKAALESHGGLVQRRTMRPRGDPFNRHAAF